MQVLRYDQLALTHPAQLPREILSRWITELEIRLQKQDDISKVDCLCPKPLIAATPYLTTVRPENHMID
jgi:hypothetical protein